MKGHYICNEKFQMTGHNICFHFDIRKISQYPSYLKLCPGVRILRVTTGDIISNTFVLHVTIN